MLEPVSFVTGCYKFIKAITYNNEIMRVVDFQTVAPKQDWWSVSQRQQILLIA